MNKVRALAVFLSDALSSVACGTEEIMKLLILAGPSALSLALPIVTAIVVLLAIVVVSSELEEIVGMADRVVVMREGRIVGELPQSLVNAEAIMAYAIGQEGHAS